MTPAALTNVIATLLELAGDAITVDVFTTESNGCYTGLVVPRINDGTVLVLRDANDVTRDYEWYIACEHIVAIRMAQP
jgi:regulator of RNase E activity RraA